jgi:hypothetical protein
VLQQFAGGNAIINNGAAGMPNFRQTRYGMATRIGKRAAPDALYGTRAGNVLVEAVPIEYDTAGWTASFVAQWPEGSDAHRSYYERIVSGPRYSVEQTLRSEPALAA